jgi:hypothetical protein
METVRELNNLISNIQKNAVDVRFYRKWTFIGFFIGIIFGWIFFLLALKKHRKLEYSKLLFKKEQNRLIHQLKVDKYLKYYKTYLIALESK